MCSCVSAGICSNNDPVPLLNQTIDVKPPSFDELSAGMGRGGSTNVERSIDGTVLFVDGCNFRVIRFHLYPPCVGTYWYGIRKGQTNSEDPFFRVVSAELGSFDGQSMNVALTQNPDSAVTWSQMDGLMLYCESEKKILGTAKWVASASASGDGDGDEGSSGTLTAVTTGLTVSAMVLLAWILE